MVSDKNENEGPVPTGAEAVGFNYWVEGGRTWQVGVTWAEIGGRIEPVEVRLRSATFADSGLVGLLDFANPAPVSDAQPYPIIETQPPFAITAQLIRELKIGQMLDDQRARFVATLERSSLDERADRWRGRRGLVVDRSTLEQTAVVYRQATRDGVPVRRALATAFNISESTAAKRVAKARAAGLLGPATPGKPGEAS